MLVDRQHCMFCHTTDMPFLAPSFREIAKRCRDTPHAEDTLVDKLKLGGSAHWGDTAMPLPAERVGTLSSEDTHTLIRWVMSK
ncbi:cytochrome c family protein [Burkholderia aenigmatica]|uniref:Cytochrome c family protein n=1 Tax=Burkholderia aenigmatica TaxID=2015348 RepID=A0A6J5IW05_9BURK|nr:cytochrome c family protein [Burkholderia aenigmatica]